jgi:hypothetical protein
VRSPLNKKARTDHPGHGRCRADPIASIVNSGGLKIENFIRIDPQIFITFPSLSYLPEYSQNCSAFFS